MKTYPKKLGAVVAVLAVTLMTASSHAADKIQLQLRLKKGDNYSLRVTNSQKMTQKILGQQQSTDQTIAMGYLFEVSEVDPAGVMTARVTYRTIQVRQTGPWGVWEYDSANPSKNTNPLAGSFMALVNRSFAAKIAPDGTVKEIQGVDALVADMLKGMSLPPGADKTAIERAIREQFGEAALKEMLEKSMNLYPSQPVGIGDSWQKRIVLSQGFPMILDNTYTLKDLKGGVAMIVVSSTLSPNRNAAPTNLGTAKLTYSLSGTQEGTLQLQESTGFVTQAQLRQKLSGQMQINGLPNAPQGLTTPISADGIMTLEQIK